MAQARAGVAGVGAVLVRPRFDVDAIVADAYTSHQHELQAFVARSTHDTGAAEDITQESFLRLCRELRGGRAPDNVRAWLYRVASNLALSRGRRATVARRWLDRTGHDEDTFEAPERTALRLERHERLRIALGSLSRDQRLGLMMAAHGFSGREIALALGRTDVATRTMLCRARFRLRSLVDEE